MMAMLHVKVVPGASRTRIAGMLGDAIKIQVAAAPEKGRANQAVIELLAAALGVKKNQIQLVAGQTQPRKTFQVEGVEQAALDAAIEGIVAR